MKSLSIIFLLIIILFSCKSESKHTEKFNKDSMQIFNLLNLKFKENINNILTFNNLNLEQGKTEEDVTLFGYDRYKSKSPVLLKFDNLVFDTANSSIILHYAETDSIIKFYELKLQNKNDADAALKKLEQKFGEKPKFFEQSSTDKGVIFLDENSNEIKEKINKKVFIWEDQKDKIDYVLYYVNYTELNESKIYFLLTVMDKTDPSYKEWKNFRSFDSYYKQ